MIAIPDFAHGGMENWGLIIYSEATLLYKPGESSESTKKKVAGVVSHELAHQVCWNIQKKVNILFFYLFLLLLQEERRIRTDKKIVCFHFLKEALFFRIFPPFFIKYLAMFPSIEKRLNWFTAFGSNFFWNFWMIFRMFLMYKNKNYWGREKLENIGFGSC